MTGWLIDTNILSELRRSKPEPKVLAFIASQSIEDFYVSVVTLAEVRFGIACVGDASHRADLEAWLAHALRPMFSGRVLPVGEDVMLRWRLLVEVGRKEGHTFSQPDLLIAATALHHELTLLSRNARDFERTGVRLVNPWA